MQKDSEKEKQEIFKRLSILGEKGADHIPNTTYENVER